MHTEILKDEIWAIRQVADALNEMDVKACERIIVWARDRYVDQPRRTPPVPPPSLDVMRPLGSGTGRPVPFQSETTCVQSSVPSERGQE